mgnify:FL=1
MYVIVRNGLFYSRTKVYKMIDIREHPKTVFVYDRLVRNAEWFDSKTEANKICKEVNGQKVIQLSEAARQRLLLNKRNRKGE